MAYDLKYGPIEIPGSSIGANEPVVIFRGRDKHLPKLMELYADLCSEDDDTEKHVALCERTKKDIEEYQKAYGAVTPMSASYGSSEARVRYI